MTEFKVHSLRQLNEKDFMKMEFYKEFPFYKSSTLHRNHMRHFERRIAERNKQIAQYESKKAEQLKIEAKALGSSPQILQ